MFAETIVDLGVFMRLRLRDLAFIHRIELHLTGEGLRSGRTRPSRRLAGLALEGVRLRPPKALAGLVASHVGLRFAIGSIRGGAIECRLIENSGINGDRISKCVYKLTLDGWTILVESRVLCRRLSPARSSTRTRVGWGGSRKFTKLSDTTD